MSHAWLCLVGFVSVELLLSSQSKVEALTHKCKMDRSSRACAHNKSWSTAKATWYFFATAANTFPLSRHTNRNNHRAAIQRQPEELGEFFQLFWRPIRVFQPSHFIFGTRWAKDNMGAENRRRGGQQGREKIKKEGITDEAETRRILTPPCLSQKTQNSLALRLKRKRLAWSIITVPFMLQTGKPNWKNVEWRLPLVYVLSAFNLFYYRVQKMGSSVYFGCRNV